MLELYNPPLEIVTPLDSFALGWTYPYAMHWKIPVLVSVAYTLLIMHANAQKVHSATSVTTKRTQSVVFKRLVIAHNIILAAFSLWILVSMSAGVISNISSLGWYGGLCDKEFTLWNAKLFRLSYYFYLSKYYEFIDTLIILYKGRKASTLQMYHHAGAVITMWSGCYYLSIPIAFFVIVNSAIHTWMYTFYALTASGIRPPGKRLLTSSQIFQFIFGISCCLFYVFCPGCQNDRQKIAIYINLAYLFPLLGLFVSFFVNTYTGAPKPAPVANEKSTTSAALALKDTDAM